MGIQGLLPLLKSIQLPISISELSGSTIGVDAYCWLHKGVYGCALQLAEGKDSDVYITYVMRRVNMMLYHKIKPVMVFDGGHLPSKGEKEKERRIKRNENRTKGLAHLKTGDRTKAMECFQKSIDISPEMAFNVIKACREKGVDCVVAPYEADAQLAYLMKAGITQYTISEDSDLLVYGCEKVIFKMDGNGNGFLINIRNLPKLSALRMDGFTAQKFRQMCILSGCDYLQSVKGMGLITAHKLIRNHSTVKKLIGTLRLNNKMKVPRDYEARFAQAEQTFLYQIVFDPNSNKLVPLNPVPDDLQATEMHFAGHKGIWSQEDAVQIALGNINPITGQKMGSIKADKVVSFVETKQKKSTESGSDKQRKNVPKKIPATTASIGAKKGPQSVISSTLDYEVSWNLNGSVKETKSSEKSNQPFVTPVRTKRTRPDADEENASKNSSLSELYSSATTDIVKIGNTVNYAKHEEKRVTIPQPRRRPVNPFRSPVIPGKERPRLREHVVSRYFGLAGMEKGEELEEQSMFAKLNASTSKNEVEDEDDLVGETPTSLPPSQSNSTNSPSSSQGSTNQDSRKAKGSQKSDPPLPNFDCYSPTEDSLNTSDSPPSSKTRDFFITEPKINNELRTKSMHSGKALENRENREPPKKKIKSCSNQPSLHNFAFVRNNSKVGQETTKPRSISPKRSILGSFSTNCLPDNMDTDGNCQNKDEDNRDNEGDKCTAMKNNEEFTKVVDSSKVEKDAGDISEETTQDVVDHQPKISFGRRYETKPKLIALRTKPKTGLSRCRPVGLSRPRPSEKKKTTSSGEIPTLMKYFEYRSRSSNMVLS